MTSGPRLPRVGRDGALALRVERRSAGSVITRSRSTLPLQVLAPVALDDLAAVVSVLTPTGGLVGGDRLTIEIDVADGAHACVSTPSATKVYRTPGDAAVQDVRLRLGGGSTLEWVPDHTIPFAGAAFRQSIVVDMASDARLILVDAFAAGRVARGEAWEFSLLDSALAVRDAHGPILHDRLVLSGGARRDGLGGAEGHPYWATLVAVGTGLGDALAFALDGSARRCEGVCAAAAPLARRGALVRLLACSAPALTAALDALWAVARRSLLELDPLALRKP